MRIELATNKTVTIQPELSITGATNTSPIQLTFTAPHHLETGDLLLVLGVAGNLATNGQSTVTVTSPSTATLDGSNGSGAYVANSGVAFHLGWATPAVLVDNTVFPDGKPDFSLALQVESLSIGNAARFIFEDSADAGFVSALPLATVQKACPLNGSFAAASFKRQDMCDMRIAGPSNYTRLKVILNSGPFSSATFSSWLLA